MMNLKRLNSFCRNLPATSHGIQWGGASVWKVGLWTDGRVFVVANEAAVSFKVSDIGWEILCQTKGCRPAPYLAARGLRWVQADFGGGLTEPEISGYAQASYAIIISGLSRRRRESLGLL